MITVTENIPNMKFAQFHELLVHHNGRYRHQHIEVVSKQVTRVVYSFDHTENYQDFNEDWTRLTTPIREVRKDQTWRKLLRRIGIKI